MDVDEKAFRTWFDRAIAPMIDQDTAELIEAGLSPEDAEEEAFEAFKRWVNWTLDELAGKG
jgi:hypothetical protein